MASLCGQSRDMGPPVRSEWPKFDGRCADRLDWHSAWCVPLAQLPSGDAKNPFLAQRKSAKDASKSGDRHYRYSAGRAPIAARGTSLKIRWRPSVALAQQRACEPGPPINNSVAATQSGLAWCSGGSSEGTYGYYSKGVSTRPSEITAVLAERACHGQRW